ncbi:hypothetical protein F9U64_12020 [Gracilibacillus oryzae]|uniref:Enamine deaminase RidA, house cleaning of reactive enamine intermediates, YjgF/YER057c/UK114 family n=1 Tax=Gracilibacillus oryzae TaxID=1672701 RepID=A0A7C8KRZ5_9BACI|nr:Rid family hydrolase [Gracilibacillus oryzae]KAB8133624.1 hypothetical protein F9U64_12020 [Gracilibacillus oryzae]
MKKAILLLITAVVLSICLFAGFSTMATSEKAAMKSNKISFFGTPTSSISSSVSIPHHYHRLLYSGTVPPLLNEDGKTTYEKYGNTEEQAVGILNKFKEDLEVKGLSLSDIVYLRVYVAPDPNKGNEPDYAGWFNAYAQFFNTEENPTKTARSTVGVESLVSPDFLIEIEAEVAYKKWQLKDN